MWPLERPADDPAAVFTACAASVRDANLRTLLLGLARTVEADSFEFSRLAEAGDLHLMTQRGAVGNVGAEHLRDVYRVRFAQKKSAGRYLYDFLMAQPRLQRCPLCGHRRVSTIDHYLPQARYTTLVVTPVNLVPACAECNTAKSGRSPTTADDGTIHPYFDVLDGDRWLFAEVVPASPASVRFDIHPPAAWDDAIARRARLHFGIFGLAKLYSLEAAEELSAIRVLVAQVRASGGAAALRQYLELRADSARADATNSWRTAMYEALSQSQWYWHHGGDGFDRP